MFEINNESGGTYNEDNQIRFKTSILRSSLCDYSNAYILVKGTITVTKIAGQDRRNNGANKKLILKNCAPFTNCISGMNNTQVDDARYTDVIILMYNLIEHCDDYSKTSGILWKYCRGEPAVDNNGAIVDFSDGNVDTNSFKVKE